MQADFVKDFQKFKKLDSGRKMTVILLMFLILLFGFVLSLSFYRSTPPPSVHEKPVQSFPSPVKEKVSDFITNLYIIKSAQNKVSVGEKVPLDVYLEGEPVQAVDIVIKFDASVFKAESLQMGGLFPQLLRKRIREGEIAVSAGLSIDNPEATATGRIFSFVLIPKTATSSSRIEFDLERTITAKKGLNTLRNAEGVILEVD